MDFLEQVMAERWKAAERSKMRGTEAILKAQAAIRKHHSLKARLENQAKTKIIAEVKKASPSAGIIVPRYAPGRIAKQYELAGATAISVLTEPKKFKGSELHLRAVRCSVDLPILRKDFICHPYQVLEAAAWHADVILLIAAGLEKDVLGTLYRDALKLGLEVLLEVHDASELEAMTLCPDAIVGVNSRNLKTLKTSLETAHRLIKLIPDNRVVIAESGIKTREDIVSLEKSGYDGFLVGESLLKSGNPGDKLRELLKDETADERR